MSKELHHRFMIRQLTVEIVYDFLEALFTDLGNNFLDTIYTKIQKQVNSSSLITRNTFHRHESLTDDNTHQCEQEELRDHKESEVTSNDGSIEARTRHSALELGEPTHHNGLHPAEQRANRRRQHTRDDCKRVVTVVRPLLEECHIGRQL